MIGLGTIINTAAIVAGGILGRLFQHAFSERMQDTVIKSTGVATLFLGIAGAMEKMLVVTDSGLSTQGSMTVILSLVLGALLGELLNLEGKLEQFGTWLRQKTHNEGDSRFLDGFLTASLTVCIGAMAVVGAIEDGLTGDYSLLAAKAVLDFIIIMIMAASLGKGCIFSAIPVAVLQGSFTLLAGVIAPILTETAIANLSMVGSILIFCVGVNLVWEKRIRVANLLPAIVFAVAFSFLL